MTIGKETFVVPEPFLVLATMNPIESDGTYLLPEAQLDRFMFKVLVDYPSYDEELVGVVAFGDRAGLSAPLSSDPARAQQALDGLSAGGGTAIGDGLNLALDQLAQRPTNAQGERAPAVVVLLSDGEDNAGRSPAVAASRAQQEGVTVNTIGVGERGVQTQLNGRTRVGLDEAVLRSIASTAGGQHFYAADAGQLEQVYAHLGSQIQWVSEPTEVTALASGIGAALLIVAGVLGLAWFGRLV